MCGIRRIAKSSRASRPGSSHNFCREFYELHKWNLNTGIMKPRQTYSIALVIVAGALWAQDPYFVNSQRSLINLNPSFAGSNGGQRAQTNWRWESFNPERRFVTYYGAFDTYIKAIKGGLAINLMTDD